MHHCSRCLIITLQLRCMPCTLLSVIRVYVRTLSVLDSKLASPSQASSFCILRFLFMHYCSRCAVMRSAPLSECTGAGSRTLVYSLKIGSLPLSITAAAARFFCDCILFDTLILIRPVSAHSRSPLTKVAGRCWQCLRPDFNVFGYCRHNPHTGERCKLRLACHFHLRCVEHRCTGRSDDS
jgi:hypothetical protein